ncbi:MAG: hypothetical protein KatS3mg008_0195 [Acidimicrobiales bacterium]|nr:MAG: hypothetical protein KatS3mg008_0195 [Acidimicrobiales bacterium]
MSAVISPDVVGLEVGPSEVLVDERRAMAFASAIPDVDRRYFDTTRVGGIVAHPLFVTSLEWPTLRDLLASVAADPEIRGSMRQTVHDVLFHRLIRPPERLSTTATVLAVHDGFAGARLIFRIDTVDADGHPVAETHMSFTLLGIRLNGENRSLASPPDEPAPPQTEPRFAEDIHIPTHAAHVWSECAAMHDPIHTDRRAALEAGLAEPILHRPALMATVVSHLTRRLTDADPSPVHRVVFRFAAEVTMPCVLRLHVDQPRHAAGDGGLLRVPFSVINQNGEPTVSRATLFLKPRA